MARHTMSWTRGHPAGIIRGSMVPRDQAQSVARHRFGAEIQLTETAGCTPQTSIGVWDGGIVVTSSQDPAQWHLRPPECRTLSRPIW